MTFSVRAEDLTVGVGDLDDLLTCDTLEGKTVEPMEEGEVAGEEGMMPPTTSTRAREETKGGHIPEIRSLTFYTNAKSKYL